MAKAMRWMGNKVVRTAQRAAHAATRNESTRARWLKTRRISTDSAGEQRQTYLSYPNHSPSTPDDPPTSRTHRVTEDNSKRDLEGSVPGSGLTRSHERVEAASGESGRSETFYMDYRWRRRVPEARYAQTSPLESIEPDRTHGHCKDISQGATYHIG